MRYPADQHLNCGSPRASYDSAFLLNLEYNTMSQDLVPYTFRDRYPGPGQEHQLADWLLLLVALWSNLLNSGAYLLGWALGLYFQYFTALVISAVLVYEQSPTFFWLFWLPFYAVASVTGMVAVLRTVCTVLKVCWKYAFRHFTLGWLLELVAAGLCRLFWTPPPVAAGCGTSLGLDNTCHDDKTLGPGKAFASATGCAYASTAAGGLTPSRLRRRARWVRVLQQTLGGRPGIVGRLASGRWTPDLPSRYLPDSVNAFLALYDGEAKLLGGGVLPNSMGEHHEPFVVVETRTGRRVIAIGLLTQLNLYACFRPRTEELLAGLRSRALQWFKERAVPSYSAALVLPDAVELAFSETTVERLSRERLDAQRAPPSS